MWTPPRSLCYSYDSHMSKTVQRYLEFLPEMMQLDLAGDLLPIRLDLPRALAEAPFNEEERKLVKVLARYILETDPRINLYKVPELDGNPGRPRGERKLLNALAMNLVNTTESENARTTEASRRVTAVCARISEYLGEDYLDVVDPTVQVRDLHHQSCA